MKFRRDTKVTGIPIVVRFDPGKPPTLRTRLWRWVTRWRIRRRQERYVREAARVLDEWVTTPGNLERLYEGSPLLEMVKRESVKGTWVQPEDHGEGEG